MSVLAELKRRNVIRMAGLYLVGAWLLVQVAGTVLPMFGAPGWLPRSIVVVLALGFVPALVFAWVFEMTPEGLKRDGDIEPGRSIAPQTARRMDRMIVAVLVLALGYFGFDKFVLAPKRQAMEVNAAKKLGRSEALATASTTTDKSIAVLPFVDMSPEHDQEYFSDGIAEELLNRLAQIPDLRVAARTSAFQFKGKNLDIADIGRQLKVAHVLEGSVRKSGTRLRITAQLINSASGYHLWSQTFEGDASDVFKVQDDISTAIAEVLETKLAGRPAADKQAVSVDPQAYDDYLQGRAFTARRVDDNLKLAVAAFDRAIARDPAYSAAHAGRAFALALSEIWNPWLPTAELVAQGRASAAEALKLDPENVEAMIARGYLAMKHWDIAGARVDFERAYALAPENVDVLNFYGDFQKLVGNLREAERMKRKAMALDPLSFVHPHDLVQVLFDQGRPREALVMAERAKSLGSPSAPYQILEAHRQLKQFDEAERALAELCPAEKAGNPGCKIERMSLLAATGHLAEARAIVAALVAANKTVLSVEIYSSRAAIYANELEDIPKATSDLRMALQGNSWNIMNPLRLGARGALL
nr:hypothetical protein [Arenimonas sp.]